MWIMWIYANHHDPHWKWPRSWAMETWSISFCRPIRRIQHSTRPENAEFHEENIWGLELKWAKWAQYIFRPSYGQRLDLKFSRDFPVVFLTQNHVLIFMIFMCSWFSPSNWVGVMIFWVRRSTWGAVTSTWFISTTKIGMAQDDIATNLPSLDDLGRVGFPMIPNSSPLSRITYRSYSSPRKDRR